MVKDQRGRRRYIAFVLTKGSPITKSGLITLIRESAREIGIEEPRLIQFDGEKGIVRCAHTLKEQTVDMLGSLGERDGNIDLKTMSTSGTLKTLRERYFTK